MPEIEEELTVELSCGSVKAILNGGADRIILTNVVLDDGQAATLAWLSSQGEGTTLELQLKVKT